MWFISSGFCDFGEDSGFVIFCDEDGFVFKRRDIIVRVVFFVRYYSFLGDRIVEEGCMGVSLI